MDRPSCGIRGASRRTLLATAKLYEVQEYFRLTNHLWAGFHISFTRADCKVLPPDIQQFVTKNFTEPATAERDDFLKMTRTQQQNRAKRGVIFNNPNTHPFREMPCKTVFYPEMKKPT